MSDTHDQVPVNRPQPGGVVRDLQRLKSDSTASAAELRDFIGNMRGKSPQEMLGMVAKSGLTRSILLATFLIALLLVVFTIGPYLRYGPPTDEQQAAADDNAAAENSAADDESKPENGSAKTVASESGDEAANDNLDPDKAVEAMGIGETRAADPDTNPLEDKLDRLLDGVE